MAYEIVKGLQVKEYGRKEKYPFKEMEVGDAFLVSRDDKARVVSSAYNNQMRIGGGVKFSVIRHASEQYPDGYACKRIA